MVGNAFDQFNHFADAARRISQFANSTLGFTAQTNGLDGDRARFRHVRLNGRDRGGKAFSRTRCGRGTDGAFFGGSCDAGGHHIGAVCRGRHGLRGCFQLCRCSCHSPEHVASHLLVSHGSRCNRFCAAHLDLGLFACGLFESNALNGVFAEDFNSFSHFTQFVATIPPWNHHVGDAASQGSHAVGKVRDWLGQAAGEEEACSRRCPH